MLLHAGQQSIASADDDRRREQEESLNSSYQEMAMHGRNFLKFNSACNDLSERVAPERLSYLIDTTKKSMNCDEYYYPNKISDEEYQHFLELESMTQEELAVDISCRKTYGPILFMHSWDDIASNGKTFSCPGVVLQWQESSHRNNTKPIYKLTELGLSLLQQITVKEKAAQEEKLYSSDDIE